MCQRRLRRELSNQGLLLLLLAGVLLLFSSSSVPGSTWRPLPGCDARLLPLEQLESWGHGGTGGNFEGGGGAGREGSSSHRILAGREVPSPAPAPHGPAHSLVPAHARHSPAHSPVPAPAPHSPARSPVPAPAHHSPAHSPVPAPAPHSPAHSPAPGPAFAAINASMSDSKPSLLWAFLIGPAVFLIFVAVAVIVWVRLVVKRRRKRGAGTTWKKGLSFQEHEQLEKYHFAGVPTITFEELEAACEEFTNVIGTSTDCIIFKGTRISDGLQIAVTRMKIPPERWTAKREIGFRHKVEDLARMNNDNLVNLVAYCATDSPFERMLVFEYASNGTLYEHLHARGAAEEHLEWPTRMRIVMGAACGLEYLHHKLVPPTSHFKFDARHVFLTEDYAAKLADFAISPDSQPLDRRSLGRRKSFNKLVSSIGYNDWELYRHTPNLESNIRSFGVFLLEVITGRPPFTDTQGPLIEWAKDYLKDPKKMQFLVDPSLKDYKKAELVAICEAVKTCIRPKTNKLPTMNELADTLSKALKLTREAANRKVSPLLWAEMELLASLEHSASLELSLDENPLGKSLSPRHRSLGSTEFGKISQFSPDRDSFATTKSLSRNGSLEQQRGMAAAHSPAHSPLPKLSTKRMNSLGRTTQSRLWASNASELELLSPQDPDSGSVDDQEAPLAASINSSMPREQESFGRSFRRAWVENSTEMSRFDLVSPREGERSDDLGR